VNGLLWVFFEKVGLALLSILATFWYANILGPENFGVAVIILSSSLLFSNLMGNIQQFPLIAANDNKTHIFATSLKGWLLISLVTSLILMLIMLYYLGVKHWLLIVLSVLYIPISSISKVFVADLIRDQKFKVLALRNFLGKLIGVSSGLTLAYFGYAELAIVLQSFIALSIALFIMARSSELFSSISELLEEKIDWFLFKELGKEGIPSGVKILDQGIKSHGLIILLGLFIGPQASGIYSLAIKFVDIPRTLIGYGFSTWATGKFYSVKHDGEKLLDTYKVALLWSMMILTPCYIGVIAISDKLVFTFFGPNWSETSAILIWLSLYHFILSFFLLLSPLQVLLKTSYNTLRVNIFSAIVMILFLVFTPDYFGLFSPIVGMFISLFFIIPKYSKEVVKMLGCSAFSLFNTVLGVILSALIMLLVLRGLEAEYQFLNLYLLVFIGALTYFIFLIISMAIGIVDFRVIKRIRFM
jgi:O-antigen/teichoic acid export membrane protein